MNDCCKSENLFFWHIGSPSLALDGPLELDAMKLSCYPDIDFMSATRSIDNSLYPGC